VGVTPTTHSNGAHYINLTWDSETGLYTAYNVGSGTDTFATINDFLNKNERTFFSLTVIE